MTSDQKDTQAKQVMDTIPEGRLAIIPLKSMAEIGKKVDDYLVQWRSSRVAEGNVPCSDGYMKESFIVEAEVPRFGSGEAKGTIRKSVRGDDVYFMVDVIIWKSLTGGRKEAPQDQCHHALSL